MHQYSVDTDRLFFLTMIGVVAAGLASIVNPLLRTAVEPLLVSVLPELLADAVRQNSFVITTMLLLSVIFTVYNALLWRLLSEYTGFESTPVLQGTWLVVPEEESPIAIYREGVEDPPDDEVYDHPQLVIGQTWMDIELGYFDPEDSYWRSDSVMLRTEDAPNTELICTYQREPIGPDPNDNGSVRGTLRLRRVSDGDLDRLVGRTYTETGTNRRLEFVRVTSPFIPRLTSVVLSEIANGTERGRREA